MSKIEALQPGEFEELLAEIDTHSIRDALVVCMLHDSAMRIEDALTVRLMDFSPDRTLVRLYDGKHRCADEFDTVPVSQRTIDRLRLWLPERNMLPENSRSLIVTSNGNRVHQQHYRRLLEVMGQRVLGKHVWPHMLRHSSITALACDHNLPLPTVQAFARHRNLSTTEKYIHVRPGWAEDVAKVWA